MPKWMVYSCNKQYITKRYHDTCLGKIKCPKALPKTSESWQWLCRMHVYVLKFLQINCPKPLPHFLALMSSIPRARRSGRMPTWIIKELLGFFDRPCRGMISWKMIIQVGIRPDRRARRMLDISARKWGSGLGQLICSYGVHVSPKLCGTLWKMCEPLWCPCVT